MRELGELLRSSDKDLAELARVTLERMVNDDSIKVTDAVSEELKGSYLPKINRRYPRLLPLKQKQNTPAPKIENKLASQPKPIIEMPKSATVASTS